MPKDSNKTPATMKAMIPITKDVVELIGEWAEGIGNRSLLHEKFCLPKSWGLEETGKLDDAGRWNVLRIVTEGQKLLESDVLRLRKEAQGKNAGESSRKIKLRNAGIAEQMSKIAKVDINLAGICCDNGLRLLADLRKSYDGHVITLEATLGSRMMVNQGGGVVQNAGISLDRCFGEPFIPGSAVKGITRAQALREIHEAQGEEKFFLLRQAMLLFGYGKLDLKQKGDFGWAGGSAAAKDIAHEIGSPELKGCACFLPAYPTSNPKLVVDMVNPHHRDYYGGRRDIASDDESPVPNYFPAVEAGSCFGFAAIINRDVTSFRITARPLLDQLKQWIERAVTHKGVGAKTAAGYGWFELGRNIAKGSRSEASTTKAVAPRSPADAAISKWKGQLGITANLRAAIPDLIALTDDANLRLVFEAVIPEAERKKLIKTNPYWQSFTSGKSGPDGIKILSRLGINLA